MVSSRDAVTPLRVMPGPQEDDAMDRVFSEILRGSFRISLAVRPHGLSPGGPQSCRADTPQR